MLRNRLLVFALITCLSTPASAASGVNLNCKIGPIEKSYGGTKWLVYDCDDSRSVLVVTAPGSPAMPFMFIFQASGGSYKLHGEGDGNKNLTDAAVKDLLNLTDTDIATLYAEAEHKK